MKEYTEMEIDALKEFVNVGTAHAATALSKLIDKTVTVDIPDLALVPVTKVPEKLGGAEIPIVGLYFKILGDITGSVLLFFPADTASSLTALLMAGIKPENHVEFEEIERSAMMELGNILTNSYINALADMIDAQIFISVPFYSSDALGAVVDYLLIEIAQEVDYALLMETEIKSPDAKLEGNFIIFPDTPSLERIFKKVGIA
ncbi:MAG: hypothetical protein A2339_07815 [Elusimicrobia bacterium RIFOXYB12_FULL_50_12]|nr:MAG: hypothetical protein A2278_02915 [Elusimicrobia bacterium RIFOXYA12_FULL_49_49]OGS10693.1 MAG: hypothetical protein A2386_07915 [Elusimicrobia bacterium RIFOXYB1_FULL_48_9]OGS16433.1 MAG: hypothetical protein A2251_06370 [Elusimicrobia bacterium RIFOXYA2_FULL_47_53]OGS27192.1 MAG: hypothetical protein A2339_07815 [Elusimicrobia bacterium RIFOXYB12_FULL_50_12]OGS30391.1 MAG: hypothetical protein A2323_02675 [Elusimicrobia bacterium RIFOXYB2_FULL_46_23]